MEQGNNQGTMSTANGDAPDAEQQPNQLPLLNVAPQNPVPSGYATQVEWETDRRAHAIARRDALLSFIQSSFGQRADLLRDTLAVAVTILFGALTLYFTTNGNEIIKTKIVFFGSLLVLLLGMIVNLIARQKIVDYMQNVVHQINRNYLDLLEASRNYLAVSTTANLKHVYDVEGQPFNTPKIPKIVEHGHTISIWAIIACIVGLSISFLLKISL